MKVGGWTSKAFGVGRFPLPLTQHHDPIASPLQRGLDRIGQPGANPIAHDQPIDHRLDRVALALPQPDRFRSSELDNFAIHPNPDKAFAFRFLDHVAEFAAFVPHQRREQDNFRFRRIGEDLIDNLLRRLAEDRLPGQRIVRLADRRKKDAQIIVNLRRGRNDGAGIRPRAALFDGDRRRKAFNEIDVRLFHLVEELPGVSREALDVTALSFGIKRVKGERRFPGPAQAGDHDQFFPRNLDVEIL